MGKKMEDLRKRYERIIADQGEAQRDLAAMQNKVESLKATMAEDATAGNREGFKMHKRQLEETTDEINVLKAYMETQAKAVSVADGHDVWKEVEKSFEKDYEEKTRTLDKAVANLRAAYLELVSVQNMALKDQEALGMYCGVAPEQIGGVFKLEKAIPNRGEYDLIQKLVVATAPDIVKTPIVGINNSDTANYIHAVVNLNRFTVPPVK